MTNANVYSIGPSSISEPAVKGGPAFSMSRPEWIAVQTYVTDALALPTTDDAFRKSLGSGASSDLSDFQQLIAAYKKINGHVTTWQKTTYPATISLASDIYDYGMNKAPVYYPPILKEADILVDDPKNQKAKDALKAILDNLKQDADERAGHAGDIAGQIKQFAEDTQADKTTMVGPKGDAGLVKYYNDEYGSTSQQVEEISKEIKTQQLALKSANAEYDHDVIVASTTPTYVWVWPVGTIAAAVVAGVYGKRATEALDRARAAQQKINTLSAELAADANLMMAIHSAELGMNAIVRDISAALPVIQKIQGVWSGMSNDLASISKLIDNDIRNALPIIMNLGVDEATRAWHNVALAADAYRVNAYVTQKSGPADSMPTLATQVSSTSRGSAVA